MIMKEKIISDLNELCFHYALYKTGDMDEAKDIASQTMNLFLLKQDVLENSNLQGWVIKTCNNYCNKYFDKCKKENNLKKKVKSADQYLLHTDWENDEKLITSFKNVWDKLTDQEMRTIIFYFHCKMKIKKMSEISGENYATLRKRISRIKKKIESETYQKLGYIASNKIITPQLNNLIRKFLLRFKENLEAQTLHTMYYYFSEIDLKNFNPDFEIVKIFDYTVNLFDGLFTAYAFYENRSGAFDSFYIKFKIDEKNHLKITVPPTKSKK